MGQSKQKAREESFPVDAWTIGWLAVQKAQLISRKEKAYIQRPFARKWWVAIHSRPRRTRQEWFEAAEVDSSPHQLGRLSHSWLAGTSSTEGPWLLGQWFHFRQVVLKVRPHHWRLRAWDEGHHAEGGSLSSGSCALAVRRSRQRKDSLWPYYSHDVLQVPWRWRNFSYHCWLGLLQGHPLQQDSPCPVWRWQYPENQGFHGCRRWWVHDTGSLDQCEVRPPSTSGSARQRLQSGCWASWQQPGLRSRRVAWRLLSDDPACAGHHVPHRRYGHSQAQRFHRLWEESHHLPTSFRTGNQSLPHSMEQARHPPGHLQAEAQLQGR